MGRGAISLGAAIKKGRKQVGKFIGVGRFYYQSVKVEVSRE